MPLSAVPPGTQCDVRSDESAVARDFVRPATDPVVHRGRENEKTMSSNETITTAAEQSRAGMQRSVDLWSESTRSLTEQTQRLWTLPRVDVGEAVRRYVDYLRDVRQLTSDAACKWVGTLPLISDSIRDQLQLLTDLQHDHAQAFSAWISGETQTLSNAATGQVDPADQDAREGGDQAGQAEATAAARRETRQFSQEARDRYQGLTKAELSHRLAERDLPRTGSVDELVDRLVSADTN